MTTRSLAQENYKSFYLNQYINNTSKKCSTRIHREIQLTSNNRLTDILCVAHH